MTLVESFIRVAKQQGDKLAIVDRATGQRETVIQLPGFTRGLALANVLKMAGRRAFIVGRTSLRMKMAMSIAPLSLAALSRQPFSVCILVR